MKKSIKFIMIIAAFLVISTSYALAYGGSHAKVVGGNYENTGSYFLNNKTGLCHWNGYNSNDSDKDMWIGIKKSNGTIYRSSNLINDNVRRYYQSGLIDGVYYAAYVEPRPQWNTYWGDCWVHEVE